MVLSYVNDVACICRCLAIVNNKIYLTGLNE